MGGTQPRSTTGADATITPGQPLSNRDFANLLQELQLAHDVDMEARRQNKEDEEKPVSSSATGDPTGRSGLNAKVFAKGV